MKAAKKIPEWLEMKYRGAKEIGDWTPNEVCQFSEYYAELFAADMLLKLNEVGYGYAGNKYNGIDRETLVHLYRTGKLK